MERIVIVAAKRTAIGKFGGQFSQVDAVALGKACLQGLLATIPQASQLVEQVWLGNVLGAGLGQNPARQVLLRAGLPVTATATTINDVCGSSLKALRLAQMSLLLGDAQVVVAGGIENMSQAPILETRPPRKGQPVTTTNKVDSLFHDGLTDSLTDQAMGLEVEALAAQNQISRLAQDKFALWSQEKAAAAETAGLFVDEIIPVTVAGQVIAHDETIRRNTSLAKLSQLQPAFQAEGTITAGNASPINDGASMLLLTTATFAREHDWPIEAYLEEFAESGVASPEFGLAPITAVKTVLEKAHLTMAQIDVVELNEAFAAQALAVQTALAIPDSKLNPLGGAIALGHPLGATGTRMIATLLTALKTNQATHGLATLCIGGGQGIAWHLSREGLV
ncbi:thiolase family protein [Lapidilactobacillus wuchangensis]|uniref:thiolase family protein n=1 Tax=Lapidilactobacillus wuchangensis TaxID=2486001 RepID=UPI000F7A8320|nr:thiolase family protein [Lapidilactobacillus wuchangensis]